MSTVQPTDKVLVQRATTLHSAPADMSTVQDTDLILVNRGGVDYKCTFADWRASQGKPPAIYDVVLSDSPEASRFTSASFSSTARVAEEGNPPGTKEIKAWVEGTLKATPTTGHIVGYSTATKILAFDSDQDLSHLAVGETINQDKGVGPTTDVINSVSTTIGPDYTPFINGMVDLNFMTIGSTASSQTARSAAAATPYSLAFVLNLNTLPITCSKIEIDATGGGYSNGPTTTPGYSALVNNLPPVTVNGANNGTRHTVYSGAPIALTELQIQGLPDCERYDRWGGCIGFGGASTVTIRAIYIDGVRLYNNAVITKLIFNTDKDLTSFSPGNAVDQSDAVAGGTVYKVDAPNRSMSIFTSKGAWAVGKTVIGPTVSGTGTIASVNVAARTVTLATSNNLWAVNQGRWAVGPYKAIANTKLFLKLNAGLQVVDLQRSDPGFTAVAGAGPYVIHFPAALPTGQPPDSDLPAGTSIQTEVRAVNRVGDTMRISNRVTPA